MPEFVSIPLSYFELLAEYHDQDIASLWLDRRHIVAALFETFRQWKINVDDIEVITEGKLSEQGVKFKLPPKRISFFFGPAYCKFTKDDASWEVVEETIQIMDAAFSTVVKMGKVSFGLQKTVIALHLQPKTTHFTHILGPFVPSQLASLQPDAIKTMASVVKWDKRKVTLDGSGAVANALFLRLERDFEGDATYDDIARQLRDDEIRMFEILDIKEDRT